MKATFFSYNVATTGNLDIRYCFGPYKAGNISLFLDIRIFRMSDHAQSCYESTLTISVRNG